MHAVLAAQGVVCGIGASDVVFGVCFAARGDGRVGSGRSFIGFGGWGMVAVGWVGEEVGKGVQVMGGTGET